MNIITDVFSPSLTRVFSIAEIREILAMRHQYRNYATGYAGLEPVFYGLLEEGFSPSIAHRVIEEFRYLSKGIHAPGSTWRDYQTEFEDAVLLARSYRRQAHFAFSERDQWEELEATAPEL